MSNFENGFQNRIRIVVKYRILSNHINLFFLFNNFNKKTIFCSIHVNKMPIEDRLTDLTVPRNVWVNRDEVAQIQSFMSRDFDENYYAIRIGSLIFILF